MKNIIILISFICFQNQSYSQKLTLPELISFVTKDIVDIHTIMSGKNWSHVKSERRLSENVSIWAYDFRKVDSTASSWLFVYGHRYISNRVSYQCHDPKTYTEIVKAILAFKPEKGLSNITEDGSMEKTYIGKNYLYKTSTSSGVNTITISKIKNSIYQAYQTQTDISSIIDTMLADTMATDTISVDTVLSMLYSTTIKEIYKEAPIYEEERASSKVIAKIMPTDKISVYNRGEEFYWVVINGFFGYIDKFFLKEQ